MLPGGTHHHIAMFHICAPSGKNIFGPLKAAVPTSTSPFATMLGHTVAPSAIRRASLDPGSFTNVSMYKEVVSQKMCQSRPCISQCSVHNCYASSSIPVTFLLELVVIRWSYHLWKTPSMQASPPPPFVPLLPIAHDAPDDMAAAATSVWNPDVSDLRS